MTDVLFSPPTHEEGIRTGDSWLRHFRITRAQSVVWDGSTFVLKRAVSDDTVRALQEGITYFRGGCVYRIDQDLANQLVAAVGGSINPIESATGYGLGPYGVGPYGD